MFLRLITIVSLLSPVFASAVPTLPEPGHYRFSGDARFVGALRSETVYGFVDQGRARLKELRSESYHCDNTGREIYRCTRFDSAAVAPVAVIAEARESFAAIELEFLAARGTPTLLFDGTAVKEWGVPQSVIHNRRLHEAYRLIESGEQRKIFLGMPARASFNLRQGDVLAVSWETAVTESREVYFRYLFEGELTRRP